MNFNNFTREQLEDELRRCNQRMLDDGVTIAKLVYEVSRLDAIIGQMEDNLWTNEMEHPL